MVEMLIPEPWAQTAVLRAVGAGETSSEPAGAQRRRVRLPEAAAEALDFCLRAFGWEEGSGDAARAYRRRASGPAPAPDLLAEMAAELVALIGRMSAEEAAERHQQILARAMARVRGRREAAPASLRASKGGTEAQRLERPFIGYYALEQHRLRHRRFDGSMSPPVDRLVFACGDAVTVLPYDPVRDTVLLIEQFRAGPFARSDVLPWCLEVVAGRCDQDEDIEETARREAREEAGLELGRLERILAYYPTPAVTAEHLTAFVGEADLRGVGGHFGLASEHEDIRAFVVERSRAQEALRSGEVNNAPLALSLMWLALNVERLRRDWAGSP